MNELKTLWSIVQLNRSPENLAYSRGMLVAVLGLVFIGQWLAKEQSIPEAPFVHWASLIFLLIFVRVLPFIIFQRTERLVQSLTALFGTDLLISLPLLIALMVVDATKESIFLHVLFLFVHTWRLVVGTFIYKLSLEFSWLQAVVTMLVLQVLNIAGVTALAHLLEMS